MNYNVISELAVSLSSLYILLVMLTLIVIVFYLVPKFMDASLGCDDHERIDFWMASYPTLKELKRKEMTSKDYNNVLNEYNRLRKAEENALCEAY